MNLKKLLALTLCTAAAAGVMAVEADAANLSELHWQDLSPKVQGTAPLERLERNGARLSRVNSSADGGTTFTYDGSGNITSVGHSGVTVTYTYNDKGLPTGKTTSGRTTKYSYDYTSTGKVKTRTAKDAWGGTEVISYSYDNKGRADIQRTGLTYGGWKDSIRFTYDAAGRIASISYGQQDNAMAYYSIEYTYDAAGNLKSAKGSSNAAPNSEKFTVAYTCDANGNVVSEVQSIQDNVNGSYQAARTVTIDYSYAYRASSGPVVALSTQNISVNGKVVNCEKYNIDGSNYFKLRDLAFLLNATASQFDVGYNAASNAVTITTGANYTPNGTELVTGKDNSRTAVRSAQTIWVNGKKADLSVYNIGGSNFFKLRDLGDAIGFDVGYNADTRTATVGTRH